jgi:hypothetical protein
MGLSNHTLDGIVDVVGFLFLDGGSLGNTSQEVSQCLAKEKLTLLRGRTSCFVM